MYISDFFIFCKLTEWRCFVTNLSNDPRMILQAFQMISITQANEFQRTLYILSVISKCKCSLHNYYQHNQLLHALPDKDLLSISTRLALCCKGKSRALV